MSGQGGGGGGMMGPSGNFGGGMMGRTGGPGMGMGYGQRMGPYQSGMGNAWGGGQPMQGGWGGGWQSQGGWGGSPWGGGGLASLFGGAPQWGGWQMPQQMTPQAPQTMQNTLFKEEIARPPMRSGGLDPLPPPAAPPTGAQAGFTPQMQRLAGMGQNEVNQLLGTAQTDAQRVAMGSAFQSAQNPFADQYLNNLWGGDAQRKAMQQRYLEANRNELPVWNAANNTFSSQQDDYARQMGWL